MNSEKELTAENLLVDIEDEGAIVCVDDRCPCPGDDFPLAKIPTRLDEDFEGFTMVTVLGFSAEWLAAAAEQHLRTHYGEELAS